MTRVFEWVALGLIFCAVFTVAVPGARSGERQPYDYRASETIVINLTTGQAVYSGSGVASHVGHFENEATGQVEPTTMSFQAAGTLTAADGDQIYWTASGVLGGDMLIVLDNGTGRFLNVSGELSSWETTNLVTKQENGFLTLTYDSAATGWISY